MCPIYLRAVPNSEKFVLGQWHKPIPEEGPRTSCWPWSSSPKTWHCAGPQMLEVTGPSSWGVATEFARPCAPPALSCPSPTPNPSCEPPQLCSLESGVNVYLNYTLDFFKIEVYLIYNTVFPNNLLLSSDSLYVCIYYIYTHTHTIYMFYIWVYYTQTCMHAYICVYRMSWYECMSVWAGGCTSLCMCRCLHR